jgi:PITH domain
MEMFPNAGSMGGAAAPDAAAPVDDGKMIDLRDKIEKAGCYARNEAAGFPMSNLFIGDSILGCKSDADEQLILHIAFREFVKVRLMDRLLHRCGARQHTDKVLVRFEQSNSLNSAMECTLS